VLPPFLVAIHIFTIFDAIITAFTSKDQGKVLITTKHLLYERWLIDWTSQLLEPTYILQVPAAAARITSPLNVDNWHIMLADYPNKPLVNFLEFRRDFILASTPVQPKSNQPNGTYSVQ